MDDIENAIFMFEDGQVQLKDATREQLIEVVRYLHGATLRDAELFRKMADVASARRL